MKKILLSSHPVSEKFARLQEHAMELGISLEFDSGMMEIRVEGDPVVYHVVDIENPEYSVGDFPPNSEYKITFEVG